MRGVFLQCVGVLAAAANTVASGARTIGKRAVLAGAAIVSVGASVAHAEPNPIDVENFGIVAADVVAGTVAAVGGWLSPAFAAGIGILVVYGGYRMVRRLVTR